MKRLLLTSILAMISLLCRAANPNLSISKILINKTDVTFRDKDVTVQVRDTFTISITAEVKGDWDGYDDASEDTAIYISFPQFKGSTSTGYISSSNDGLSFSQFAPGDTIFRNSQPIPAEVLLVRFGTTGSGVWKEREKHTVKLTVRVPSSAWTGNGSELEMLIKMTGKPKYPHGSNWQGNYVFYPSLRTFVDQQDEPCLKRTVRLVVDDDGYENNDKSYNSSRISNVTDSELERLILANDDWYTVDVPAFQEITISSRLDFEIKEPSYKGTVYRNGLYYASYFNNSALTKVAKFRFDYDDYKSGVLRYGLNFVFDSNDIEAPQYASPAWDERPHAAWGGVSDFAIDMTAAEATDNFGSETRIYYKFIPVANHSQGYATGSDDYEGRQHWAMGLTANQYYSFKYYLKDGSGNERTMGYDTKGCYTHIEPAKLDLPHCSVNGQTITLKAYPNSHYGTSFSHLGDGQSELEFRCGGLIKGTTSSSWRTSFSWLSHL